MINRFTKDVALIVALALPAASASVVSDAIDLGAVSPGPIVDDFDVLIEVPALPNLVDTKKVTITLKDSADGVTFAAIPELATLVITGAGGVGAGAAERRVKLPPSVRQHLAMDIAVEAAGGNNTAVEASLSLVF